MAQFEVQTVDPNSGTESWTAIAAATADEARDRVLATGMVIGAVRLKSMDGPASPLPDHREMEQVIFDAQEATDWRRVNAAATTLCYLGIIVALIACAYLFYYLNSVDSRNQRKLDAVNAKAAQDIHESNQRWLNWRPDP